MVLAYPGLMHFALCCLQTNILPDWFVTSTMQCFPLHHKMPGYGGMISDILTVCGFLINIPFSSTDTSKHNPFNVLMNCLMFKAVTDVYGYVYIYRYEYKCL
jgi:hypothetical protein